MNIRPLDLQVMIPKSTDVAKIAQAQDQQGVLQQQQKTEQWQKNLVQREQQVQTKPASSKATHVHMEDLDSEEQRKGSRSAHQDHQRDHPEEEPENSSRPPQAPANLGSRIDIKT